MECRMCEPCGIMREGLRMLLNEILGLLLRR